MIIGLEHQQAVSNMICYRKLNCLNSFLIYNWR